MYSAPNSRSCLYKNVDGDGVFCELRRGFVGLTRPLVYCSPDAEGEIGSESERSVCEVAGDGSVVVIRIAGGHGGGRGGIESCGATDMGG